MTKITSPRKTKQTVSNRLNVYRKRALSRYGVIGNLFSGEVYVPGLTNVVYVTNLSTGEITEMVNRRVPPTLGTPVRFGIDEEDLPGTLQVLSVWPAYENSPLNNTANALANHHEQHEWPNGDTAYIWGEQFLPSCYFPVSGALSVQIYPGNYYTASGWVVVKTITTIDLSALSPALTSGQARMALIVFDSAGASQVRVGTAITGWDNLDAGDIPTPTTGDNVICAVKMYYGQTEFRRDGNNNDFIDLRWSGLNSAPPLIPSGSVTLAQMANLTGPTIIGKVSGTGAPEALTPAQVRTVDGTAAIVGDPTGFSDPSAVVINYDPTTQKVTLTGTWTAYYQGQVVTALTSGWVSAAHANTAGNIYRLYYDGSNFVWSTNTQFPSFSVLQIVAVNYNTSDKYAIRECHGLMPWNAHEVLHNTVGAFKKSGGSLGSYVLASTTAGDRRPTVSEVVMQDEDLPTTLPALSSDLFTQAYLAVGATAVTAYAVDAAEIVPVLVNNPYWNEFTSGAWKQTLMANNSYMCVWHIGVPVTASTGSQKYRYLWVQGQSNTVSLATQQALTPGDVNLGTLVSEASEFVFLNKIIIRFQGGNWDWVSVTALTGNRFQQVGSPAGNYLASVTTDTTLTGNGTAATPLGVSTTITSQLATLREVLTAARTYYVRTDGNDANNGLANTAGGAFLTIQKAFDTIPKIDLGGYVVTIQVGDGTYTSPIAITTPWVGGNVVLQGNTGTPANVLISTTSATCLEMSCAGNLSILGMEFRTTTSGDCVKNSGPGKIQYSNVRFGASAGHHVYTASPSSFIECVGAYAITGNALRHFLALTGFIRCNSVTVTVSAGLTFTDFVFSTRLGLVQCQSVTWSTTTATGRRYLADTNAVIYTNGAGANYFPGNSAGATSLGGQYI